MMEMDENWSALSEALNGLDEGDKTMIKEFFNNLLEGEDDIGDHLFGEYADFETRFSFLDPNAKQ